MENANGTLSYCEKMDGVARWFSTSIATAFFASLERCSCVNLNTDDDEEDYEANGHRPLMFTTSSNSFSSSSNRYGDSTVANNPCSAVKNLPV